MTQWCADFEPQRMIVLTNIYYMLSMYWFNIYIGTITMKVVLLLSTVPKWGRHEGTERSGHLAKVTEPAGANEAVRPQRPRAGPAGHAASPASCVASAHRLPPPPSHQMSRRRLSRQRTLLKMFSSILPTLSCFIGSDETFVTTTAIAMIISMLKTFAYKADIFSSK